MSLAEATSTGVVTAFDSSAGLGTVMGHDTFTYRFHCVEIADGTRTIEVGRSVEFDVLAKLGSFEAGCLRPI